jgi:Fic family protein
MTDPFANVATLPGVPEAVARTREAVDRLLGHRILRRRSAEVSAESLLRGARASAALEGVSVPLEEVRGGGLSNDPVVQGALRVSAELGLLADTWRKAPRQALARLHALAAADAVDPDALGRPRPDAEASDPLELGPPPPPADVVARLDVLSDLLTASTDAPALVVAALVHGELVALRPFGWGDGVVARAAARLTLVDRGLDPKSLTAPEVGHVELRDAYGDALRGYAAGTPDGVARWVRHFAEAVELGARDALAVCEAFLRG